MAKKAIKKKSVKKKTKNVKTSSLPKTLPSVKKVSKEKSENKWLCTIATVMFFFFLMAVYKPFGLWVIGVQWWIWLLLAIVIGYKPMMKYLKK